MGSSKGKKMGVVGFFGFFSKVDEITKDDLTKLMRSIVDEQVFEVKGVFSARGTRNKVYMNESFQEAIKACEAQDVDLFIINTVDIFKDDVPLIMSYVDVLKMSYGVRVYFAQEQIDSEQEEFIQLLSLESVANSFARRKREFRKSIQDALGNIKEGKKQRWKISLR